MKSTFCTFALVFLIFVMPVSGKTRVLTPEQFGLKAGTGENASPVLKKMIESITNDNQNDKTVIRFSSGRYDFYEDGAFSREYYISNHDQDNPKRVAMSIEELKNITIDGNGASLVFHGRMIPLAIVNTENCRFKNFSIDFENPHISQIEIIENTPDNGITFRVAPWVHYRITPDSVFESFGEGWTIRPRSGIAFENKTRHVVYNTSDLGYSTKGAKEIAPRTIQVKGWKDKRLIPGTIVAMRAGERPTPGIFLSHGKDTYFENIRIHYAEGMGLLAQLSENITLDGFGVCLKGNDDPRYFTTQADATHFSGCKGKIISKNGLYEGMMDDAINIHGTYLKVVKRLDNRTFVGRYMHGQSWGFTWGNVGDEVQFIDSETMEIAGNKNRIIRISPYDKPQVKGAREYIITFEQPVDADISDKKGFGIENLEWTPEVIFSNNIVRNNRARGALFSTPKKTIIEKNLFDHTSGTAILLCGDCNGWYETGACREVIIRNNRFINALTNMFQFTNAIISIYPEIPNLAKQQAYFHGGEGKGILIENNVFETFDQPIVYAKSTDGITFRKNTIKQNNAYPAFHWNNKRFFFERVKNIKIENNSFDGGFDYKRDVREQ